jgi:hypothetical protein
MKTDDPASFPVGKCALWFLATLLLYVLSIGPMSPLVSWWLAKSAVPFDTIMERHRLVCLMYAPVRAFQGNTVIGPWMVRYVDWWHDKLKLEQSLCPRLFVEVRPSASPALSTSPMPAAVK